MSSKRWLPNDEENQYLDYIMQDVKKLITKHAIKKPNIMMPSIKTDSYQFREIDFNNQNIADLELNQKDSIDKRNALRIDRGEYMIDSTIDLHGYTIHNAFIELETFIMDAWNKRLRLLLVITGNGSGGNSIRDMLMKWLNYNHIRPCILRVSIASSKHGSKGAFYVLLKRERTDR